MIRRLLALINDRGRRYTIWLIGLTVASAVVQGLAFVALVPYLEGLVNDDRTQARTWAWVLVGLACCYAVLVTIASVLGQRTATEIIRSLLRVIGDRLVQLPIGYFGPDRSGSVTQLATRGIVFTSTVPYALLRPIIIAFVTPATVMVCTFFIQWRIALAMVLAVPIIWFTYRFLSNRIKTADGEHVQATADAAARLVEFSRNQPALRMAGSQSVGQQLVARALETQYRANRKVHLSGGGGIAVFGVVVQAIVAALIALICYLMIGGTVSVVSAITLLVLAARFTEPIINSGALGGALAMARNTLEEIQKLLDEHTLPEPANPLKALRSDIQFDTVTFGYDPRTPVLRDISFEAPAGAVTAIVGPSGSGKTTITRLIARFHEPDRGTISIGGIKLVDLGSATVAAMVAPVFQDVYLFDGTIYDNIAVGNPDASPQQIEQAARDARVDEIVERLPHGWQTRVGEGGANLSGGERQRVSIARALLKNAPIVLLDEATAALDVDNESAVSAAVEVLGRDRTVVVVAHRLQTIARADRILMLSADGTIAESGSHDELLAANGAYHRYWTQRVEATQWRLNNSAIG